MFDLQMLYKGMSGEVEQCLLVFLFMKLSYRGQQQMDVVRHNHEAMGSCTVILLHLLE
jgi:hypothetical protein